jgi:hypothetical protein
MKTLISEAEKMLKRAVKKGEIKMLDYSIFEEILDKVDEDMEDYRIQDNYRTGMSRIEIERLPDYIRNN